MSSVWYLVDYLLSSSVMQANIPWSDVWVEDLYDSLCSMKLSTLIYLGLVAVKSATTNEGLICFENPECCDSNSCSLIVDKHFLHNNFSSIFEYILSR